MRLLLPFGEVMTPLRESEARAAAVAAPYGSSSAPLNVIRQLIGRARRSVPSHADLPPRPACAAEDAVARSKGSCFHAEK